MRKGIQHFTLVSPCCQFLKHCNSEQKSIFLGAISRKDFKLKRRMKRIKNMVELEQEENNNYGDGVVWIRGKMLGKGNFGSVYLATLKKRRSKYSCFPSSMAVKSAEVSVSGSIQKEREVLSNFNDCPYVIRCFAEEITRGKNGNMVYNLLLEYGSGGTLADRIEKLCFKGLPEFEVKCYTRSILKGLICIHERGYVHCDLKPDNILLVPISGKRSEFRAKIGDFGLAKRVNLSKKRKIDPYWRGTPMYLSPETVAEGVQQGPSDIWALGCIVLTMLTGKPPWERNEDTSADDVIKKIGEGKESPKIPNELSKEAKDFLKRCFVRKTMFRFTAEMLLQHAFLEGLSDDNNVFKDLNSLEESTILLSESEDEKKRSFESEDDDDDDSCSHWSEEEEEDDDVETENEFSSYLIAEDHMKGGVGCDHAIIQPALPFSAAQISSSIT